MKQNLIDGRTLINKFEECETQNTWSGTSMEKYASLGAKQRGSFAEKVITETLREMGYEINDPENYGHDFIMDGRKTELKFCLATSRNTNWRTIFNHIGLKKDWDQIILGCVNGDCSVRLVLFSKDNLPILLMTHQQGGKNSDNDDYMISGKSAREVLFHQDAEVIIGE